MRCRPRPLSKTDVSEVDEPAVRNGEHVEPGLGRIAAEVEGQGREHVAHPGPTTRSGEDRLPVLGVLSAGLVGHRCHQIGHRLGGKEDLVATGGPLQPGGGPGQPGAEAGFELIHGNVGKVLGGGAGPGRTGSVGGSGHQMEGTLRLGVGQAHAGGDAQVLGGATVFGESGQDVVGVPGAAEGTGQLTQHTGQDGQVGLAGGGVEAAPSRCLPCDRVDGCRVVIGRRGADGVLLGRPHQLGHVDVAPAAGHPGGHARRLPGAC